MPSTCSGECLSTVLIPDAPSTVMRDGDGTLRFLFLHGVIQEEIDQDSIHMRLRIITNNLTPDEFHAPDTATTQLYFPGMTATNRLQTFDMMVQGRAILQAAQ